MNKNAYIFIDKYKNILTFIYAKLDKNALQKALPIFYQDDEKKNYLVAFFDSDGRDYVGQLSKKEIDKEIKKLNMYSLFESYNKLDLPKDLINEKKFNIIRNKCAEQLKYL
tara:strand:+ start:193 stop:525 length:333 start_codon:yes stop_codon:yes gene_type:complete